MATAALGAQTTLAFLNLGASTIAMALRATYQMGGAINEFIDRHIHDMRQSDIPTVERSGRVLEAAKVGFGIGYAAPIVIIAAGQIILGNPLNAVAVVGSALTLSNPIAMTCAAVGAIYYGYSALSENERKALLDRLSDGLELGVQLVRSIVEFTISTVKELLSGEQIAEFKKFIRSTAETFGRHLSDVTRSLSDKVADGLRSARAASRRAASGAGSLAGRGLKTAQGVSGIFRKGRNLGEAPSNDVAIEEPIRKRAPRTAGSKKASAGKPAVARTKGRTPRK